MIQRGKMYAWEEGGKWRVSLFRKIVGKPSNVVDTQPEVMALAVRRGLEVEWLSDGSSNPD